MILVAEWKSARSFLLSSQVSRNVVFQVSFSPVAQPMDVFFPLLFDLREGHWGKCRPCRFITAQLIGR